MSICLLVVWAPFAQWSWAIVTYTARPLNPKILTIWHVAEKVCQCKTWDKFRCFTGKQFYFNGYVFILIFVRERQNYQIGIFADFFFVADKDKVKETYKKNSGSI